MSRTDIRLWTTTLKAALAVGASLTLSHSAQAAIYEDFDTWAYPMIYSPSEPMPAPWYISGGIVAVSGGGAGNNVATLYGSGMGYAFTTPLSRANTGALVISVDVRPGSEASDGPNFARLTSVHLTGPETGPGAGPAYMPVTFNLADANDPPKLMSAEVDELLIEDYLGQTKGVFQGGAANTVTFAIDAGWTEMTRTVSWNGSTLASWTQSIDDNFTVTGMYMDGASTTDVLAPYLDNFYASVPEPATLGAMLCAASGLLLRRRS